MVTLKRVWAQIRGDCRNALPAVCCQFDLAWALSNSKRISPWRQLIGTRAASLTCKNAKETRAASAREETLRQGLLFAVSWFENSWGFTVTPNSIKVIQIWDYGAE